MAGSVSLGVGPSDGGVLRSGCCADAGHDSHESRARHDSHDIHAFIS
jgi:hypothetical protein